MSTLNNSISTGISLGGNYLSPLTITANGTIVTSSFAVADTNSGPSLLNEGLVDSTDGVGVFFTNSGEVRNAAGATITAYFPAVEFEGTAVGTVLNAGTIISSQRTGVYLGGGGTVTNSGTASLIQGAEYGVQARGYTTLANAGQVTGTQRGVALYAGGSIFNTGSITGSSAYGYGVYLNGGGAVTNAGSGALISGYNALLIKGGSGTVGNEGTIAGQKSGIVLKAGGSVSNASTGIISTGSGIAVDVLGAAGTVYNAGTIANQSNGFGDYGVTLAQGGTVTNTGLITGYRGIRIDNGAGTVDSWGTVSASGYAAIELTDGGYIAAGGLITAQNGIVIGGAAAQVHNSGTIIGGNGTGIQLGAGGYLANDPRGTISGSADGVQLLNAIGTVINLGLINGSTDDGVYLAAGGTIFNEPGYIISGGDSGADARGSATLFNYGTVTGGFGVDFSAGGFVENSRGTSVIAGTVAGVVLQGTTASTVWNNGTITGLRTGVELDSGGYVANVRQYAVISGYVAIYTGGTGPSTVLNEGTVTGGTASGYAGVYLGQGGTVTNFGTAALITGYKAVVDRTGSGTVLNQLGGTISGNAIAVELFQGGSVSNEGAGALISGGIAGIQLFGTAGTVTNFSGTITAGSAIVMQAGGYVYNSAGGLIAASDTAIEITGQSGSVQNWGSITGGTEGIILLDGGRVANTGTSATIAGTFIGVEVQGSGTVYNTGSIVSSEGQAVGLYAGGTVTNFGAAAVITGYNNGIDISNGSGTVLNQGLVQATNSFANGVNLQDGGTVTNNGTIAGYNGVNIEGGGGTVINTGSITAGTGGDAYGIRIYDAGYVLNSGTSASISGGRLAVQIRGTGTLVNDGTMTSGTAGTAAYLMNGGTVTNSGVISAGDAGVALGASGTVDNTGSISGGNAGVSLYGGGTVTNSGTIAGSYAVFFGAGYDLLVAEAGAVFEGNIKAYGNNNTLALGSGAGTLSGIGSTITGFSTIALAAGAAWTLSGNSAGLTAPGVTITGLTSSDVLDLTDFAATSASYIAGTGLVLSNAGASETIALSPKQPNANFAVTADGTGGTDFTELGVHTLVTNYAGQLTITSNGAYLNAFTVASGVTVSAVQGAAVYSGVVGVSLTNYGAISVLPSGGAGKNTAVDFSNGGYVSNLGTAALISGDNGVSIANAAGTVVNQGTIAAGAGTGVALSAGGYVGNLGTTSLITGDAYGVLLQSPGGTVLNEGTITANGPADIEINATTIYDPSIGGSYTFPLTSAYVGNLGTAALLTGAAFGISIDGGTGTAVNQGTILGGIYGIALGPDGGLVENLGTNAYISGGLGAVSVSAGTLGQSATVINAGTMAGGEAGVGILNFGGATAYVQNSGAILASSGAYGVGIYGAGTITNTGPQATIASGGNGITFLDGTGTVLNAGGTITGTTTMGVGLNNGGYVYNSGLIRGGQTGIVVANQYGTVTNTGGSIAGASAYGIRLTAGGYVHNSGGISGGQGGVQMSGYGGVLNFDGTITGTAANGVTLGSGGYVYNHGTGAVISGGSIGVAINDYGTLVNVSGSVSGAAGGVRIQGGTYAGVVNAGGTISGGVGVYLADKFNSVYNAGVISGSNPALGIGVALGGFYLPGAASYASLFAGTPFTFTDTQYGGNALLSNASSGTVTGVSAGVELLASGGATVLNQGLISGGTFGIYQSLGAKNANAYYGVVVNAGTISGGADGVVLTSSFNVLINDGTIAGGTYAVELEGKYKTLIVDQGAAFDGKVVAVAGGYSRLILSTAYGPGVSLPTVAGTLTGIGSQITGFNNINIYSGDTWVLSGDSAGLASGQFINGFLSGNEIDLTDIKADSESFANNVLTLFEAGSIVGTLNISAENATTGSFALTSDTGTGTDITRLPSDPHTLTASLGYGIVLSPTGRYNSPYTVTNAGTIASGATGIYSAYNASVTVYGTVTGYQGGIVLTAGGTVAAAGHIGGADYTGTYGDNAAVQFSGGAGTLVVENGASFTGFVTAASGYNNVLDIETTSLGGIGTTFQGFTTIDLGTEANSIAGTSAGLATGETIDGFIPGDTIDFTDLTVDSISDANGTLTLFNGGTPEGSLAVDGSGPYSTDFALVSDGGSGTDVVALATRTISTTLNTGVTLSPNLAYSNDLVITNTGAVLDGDSFGRAVYQNGAGHISIANGATVAGWIGVYQKDGTGAAITNAGLINATDLGIALHRDGTVFNTGTILGNQDGIAAYQTATIDNQGLISGGAGIYIGGDFVNVATLENGGTIIGTSGVAVSITNSPADVIVDAGAVFTGQVIANPSQSDMLELASSATTGTISGIGTSFTGFSTIEIDTGATWVISGDSAGLAAGQTLIGNGTIDITDLKADSSSYANGVLSLYASGLLVGTLNIDSPRPATSSDFAVYTDGGAGTEIVLGQPSPYVINTSLSNGIYLTSSGAYRSPLTITNTGAVIAPGYAAITSNYAATILNDGTVSALSGNGRAALMLRGGGNVTNGPDGLILGRLYMYGSGGNTLTNAGTIAGFMALHGCNVYLHNETGAVLESGTGAQELAIFGIANVVNAGTINETGNGLLLGAGGTVTNLTGGYIYGGSTGVNLGAGGTITNGGTIGSGQYAVYMRGGAVTNGGTIQGGSNGVNGYGAVFNSGLIIGATGINNVTGGREAVQNAGTIDGTSGIAIDFGSTDADLIVAPGAVFIGDVIADEYYNNTLELTSTTSTGTLTGLNSQFANFQNIIVDDNAAWTLTGVNATNTIDITNFTTTGGTVTIGATDELSIGNLTLSFSSGDTGGLLTIASDGHGGTEITNVLCFLEGTNIATPAGETTVESLKIGDAILTATGETVPVRWIGIHTAATHFADPLCIMPIRIHAGALGNNLPHRDLLVSPDHAMYLGGVLIQAGALVNGINITRERRMPERFTYYHVETARHDLILAEGAATETFVDNVDRMAFDNWEEHQTLYGSEPPIAEMPHPRTKSARQIPLPLRRQLAAAVQALVGAAA